jgi:hypothetical protein
VWLDITKTTKLLDAQGKALGSLSVELATSPPAPPTERAIIYAYDFQPDGAAFEPPITLTMTFDPETLPSGIAEDELYIAYRDGSQWLALKSIMDTEANRVSAAISHFTQYALISKLPLPAPKPTTVPTYAPPSVPEAAPAPASFAISDLLITPSEVEPAEQVTISAIVTNIGGSVGSYTVHLMVNGAEQARKEVTLGAGKSETVTFTVAKDTEGSYTININGNSGQFTVIVPSPPTPALAEALPIQPSTNWRLIGGIIGGCVVAVGLLLYLFRWRKGYKSRNS